MNFDISKTESNNQQCCVDYCKAVYNVANKEVTNNYRCHQKFFSSANLWRLRKNRKAFSINSGYSVIS